MTRFSGSEANPALWARESSAPLGQMGAPNNFSGPVYELCRPIASGGMGDIWEARQISLGGRLVAVKRIRADVLANADADAQARMERQFQQEALAAARLEHPNIVPIHDLGADADGLPLLAMKLVRGDSWNALLKRDFAENLPETEFLAKHLSILASVANAVAFAHANGIVHRDLKPHQVMVGRFGETLLMDWGLALFLPETGDDARLDEIHYQAPPPWADFPTRETASNPAGTPALMAPEQTEPTARNIGPWTDIYLLGGTLYYLLTGTYPHKMEGGAVRAMVRAAEGSVEPPAERAPDRVIPAELADLAMRALAKKPEDRVSSAEAFVQALQDYLSGASKRRESERLAEQVEANLEALRAEAGSLSVHDLYIRRGEASNTLARALQLWPENAKAARLRARNLAARVDAEISHGDLLLAEVHLKQLGQLAAANFFERESARVLEARLDQALQTRALAKAWRRILLAAALAFLAAALGFGILATLNAKAADERALEAAEERDKAHRARQDAERNLAIANEQGDGAYKMILFVLNELKSSMEAELIVERGLTLPVANEIKHAIAGRVVGKALDYFQGLDPETWPRELKLQHATRLWETGLRLERLGLSKEGEALVSASLALRESLLEPDHPDIAFCVNALATILDGQGRYPEAEALYRRAIAILEKTLGPDHTETASPVNNLASLFMNRGDLASAEPLFWRALATKEKALGVDHVDLTFVISNLGGVLKAKGDFAGAETLYRRVLTIREKALGADHSEIASALNDLATLFSARGDLASAEPLHQRAVEIREKRLGPHHPDTAQSLNNLAITLKDQGNLKAAEPLYRRALMIREKVLGADHPHTANTLNNLASLLRSLGNLEEAEALHQRALAIREKALGPDHPAISESLNNLATLFQDKGDYAESERLHRRALSIREKTLGLDHPQYVLSLHNFAIVLFLQDKVIEALEFNGRAIDGWKRLAERDPGNRWVKSRLGFSLYNQACFGSAIGQIDEALANLEESVRLGGFKQGTIAADARLNSLRDAAPERFAALIELAESDAEN
jgi:serine/threonine protein kinase/tetratricopeptide (TPR) repeat protein